MNPVTFLEKGIQRGSSAILRFDVRSPRDPLIKTIIVIYFLDLPNQPISRPTSESPRYTGTAPPRHAHCRQHEARPSDEKVPKCRGAARPSCASTPGSTLQLDDTTRPDQLSQLPAQSANRPDTPARPHQGTLVAVRQSLFKSLKEYQNMAIDKDRTGPNQSRLLSAPPTGLSERTNCTAVSKARKQGSTTRLRIGTKGPGSRPVAAFSRTYPYKSTYATTVGRELVSLRVSKSGSSSRGNHAGPLRHRRRSHVTRNFSLVIVSCVSYATYRVSRPRSDQLHRPFLHVHVQLRQDVARLHCQEGVPASESPEMDQRVDCVYVHGCTKVTVMNQPYKVLDDGPAGVAGMMTASQPSHTASYT
jgi:hypothetical protein